MRMREPQSASWCTRRVRRAIIVILVALLGGVTAASAFAAAPRLILVDRGGLSRPIVLADWSENGTLLTEWLRAHPTSHARIRCRPAYRLSFMWGPEWNENVDSGKPFRAIRPRDTDAHGRFWPAWRGHSALLDPGHGVLLGARVATPTQLRILRRHGVPVRVASGLVAGCKTVSD
jgi:hypothetical protein